MTNRGLESRWSGIRHKRVSLISCTALLLLFGALSWTAVRTKNATADEPLHALGAYMRLFYGDFRLDPEDPPLFGYWAMIPHSHSTVRVDRTLPQWDEMLDYMWRQWQWVQATLYRTEGNDPDRFINRSRVMMLILGVALGALIALWAGQLDGAVAAIAACAMFCLDPTFLGHAPLVKNDVPITLACVGLFYATWMAGQRLTILRAMSVALLLGAALNVKFSAMLFIPMLVIALLIRALLPRPWIALGRVIALRWQKLGVALGLIVLCAVVSTAMIWICYGLRYAPTPDPSERLNMMMIAKAAARTEILARDPSSAVTEEQIQAHPPSRFTRSILWIDQQKLLPQAWLAGLLDTYATTRMRPTWLNGEKSLVGWWYYFPLAILYKTPLATLVAIAGAMVVTLLLRMRRIQLGIDVWAVVCLGVPLVIYGLSLILSKVNLGLRHALPVYPFIFIFVGIVVAHMWQLRPRITAIVGAILMLGLTIETLASHPHYIAFFNRAVGGARGGLALLGDSNLDWGQDVKLLRRWQQQNPDTRLYLCYFGGVDPGYYVNYGALPGTWGTTQPQAPPTENGVIAVSATQLQGIYLDPPTAIHYEMLRRRREPIDVLGGTIYLYRFP